MYYVERCLANHAEVIEREHVLEMLRKGLALGHEAETMLVKQLWRTNETDDLVEQEGGTVASEPRQADFASLRAQLGSKAALLIQAENTVARLTAENAQLRDALRAIVAETVTEGTQPPRVGVIQSVAVIGEPVCAVVLNKRLRTALEAARALLGRECTHDG